MFDRGLPIWGEDAGRRLKLDCRRYRGDRPCTAGVQGVCPSGCEHYAPMGHRIVIIKLAALGDVIRTAAILPGLKERWPTSHITWVTRSNGVRMLRNHPLVDRLLPFDAETLCHLEHERFNLCLSLDKEPGPAALAMRIDARERRGLGLSPHGTPFPLNPECVEYFLLGLDDRKKFVENAKSYQQLIYEALGLEYARQRYRLYPGDEPCRRARQFWAGAGVTDRDVVIGLNPGAGRIFAHKSWPPERFIELAKTIGRRTNWRVALFGGPDEHAGNARVAEACPAVVDTGCDHDESSFVALLQRCDVLVTGDTMAMHVAIAMNVPCVVLFGPTCEQEIDLYGRGEKLRAALPCSPCYARRCDRSPNCMDQISVEQVWTAVQRWARHRPSTAVMEPIDTELVPQGSEGVR
jgi:ADP-heptose:LPS heptosyltransferase